MAENKKITFEPAFEIGETVALVCDADEVRQKWIIVAYYVTRTFSQYVLSSGDTQLTVFDFEIELFQ